MNKLYEESLVKRIKSELAKELHDEIGSALAVISSRIKLAKLKLEQEDKLSPEYFDNAEKQADSLLKSTRDFIWTVASSDEDPRNVFYYLKDFGEELFEDSCVEFTTDFYDKITGTDKLSSQQVYHIILMFKEVFTNVIKHADASTVDLQLILNDSGMIMEVSDNGVGFDKTVKEIKPKSSFGLKNLSYRANKIGGFLNVESEKREGTRVILILPLEKFGCEIIDGTSFITGQAS